MPAAAPLEERVSSLEEKYSAHDRLIGALHDEMAVQSSRIRKVMVDGPDALRQSHHDLEVGLEVKVAQIEMNLQRQLVNQTYLRKENRALAAGLAGLLFVGWVLSKVEVNATTVVGLVSALLAAIALYYQQLQKGERKAKDSLVPPKP